MSYNANPFGLGPTKVTFNNSPFRRPNKRVSEPLGSKSSNAGSAFNPFSSELSSGGSSTGSLSTLTGSVGSPRISNSNEGEINLTSSFNEYYVNKKLAGNPVAVKKPVQTTHEEELKKLENAGIRATVKAQMAAAKKLSQGGLGRRRRRSSKKARKSCGRKTRRR